jgi:hypothetical protein
MVEYTTPPPTPRNRGDHEAFHVSTVTPLEDIRTVVINRVTWGAVFSGVAMAISVQLILNLLGVGVGMPAFDSSVAVSTLSLSAISWGIISGIIAAGCGGYTAGRLAGEVRETTAAWHGLTSWAASVVVVTVLLVAGASSVVGGTLNVAGVGGTSYARNGAVNTQANMQNSPAMTATTPATPGAIAPGTAADATATPDATASAPVAATAPVTNGPVVTNGTVTVDAATISRGALIAVLGLVLSALAAWFGGWFGTVQPTVTVDTWQGRQLH